MIGTLTRGKRFVHADATDTGVPCIHYGELYTYYGVYAKKAKSHIREELRNKMRYAHKGDVVIVGAGENKTDIGVGLLGKETMTLPFMMLAIRSVIMNKILSLFHTF